MTSAPFGWRSFAGRRLPVHPDVVRHVPVAECGFTATLVTGIPSLSTRTG